MAYFSYETGRPEVFVASFPGPGAKYQISSGGAGVVRWGTGNRLFSATTGDRLVEAEPAIDRQSLQVKSIRPMFTLPILGVSGPQWDITRDGNRIIGITPASPEANSIGLLLNWQAELKK